MCGCYCNEIIDFILNNQSFINCTILFSADDLKEYEKNTSIISVDVIMYRNENFMQT